jgi:hypothetical protein
LNISQPQHDLCDSQPIVLEPDHRKNTQIEFRSLWNKIGRVLLELDAEGIDIGMTLLKLFGCTFLPTFLPHSSPLRPPNRQAHMTRSLKSPKISQLHSFQKLPCQHTGKKRMSTPKRFELLPTNGFDIRKLIRVKRLNHSARAPG